MLFAADWFIARSNHISVAKKARQKRVKRERSTGKLFAIGRRKGREKRERIDGDEDSEIKFSRARERACVLNDVVHLTTSFRRRRESDVADDDDDVRR